MIAALGRAHARAGDSGPALRALDQLEALRSETYVSPLDFAVLKLALGDRAAAFEWLDRAVEERVGRLIWMQVHPLYDPLRDDPRFPGLLRKLHFPRP